MFPLDLKEQGGNRLQFVCPEWDPLYLAYSSAVQMIYSDGFTHESPESGIVQ